MRSHLKADLRLFKPSGVNCLEKVVTTLRFSPMTGSGAVWQVIERGRKYASLLLEMNLR